MVKLAKLAAALLAVAATLALALDASEAAEWSPPPPNAGFDYQIGGDYPLPDGVDVVSRDWFSGTAAPEPAYSICYVNAFQTQDDERGVDRPDERSNWPRNLVLRKLGDDPRWGGEYLVDISTRAKRSHAAAWIEPMLEACARGGFSAVELDNLDSWTRFNGTPLTRRVPFGRSDAIAFAKLLATSAHDHGLAVAQKNTASLGRGRALSGIGFDFAIAEDCARYDECRRYTSTYGDRVIAIEYRRPLYRKACRQIGERVSVVLRDRLVTRPGSRRHLFATC